MSRQAFAIGLCALVLLGVLLRGLFPTADPPWRATSGVVWHDEGAWTHNARNRALFGTWTMDAWNPMYIAPVFTGLEYASFRTFGVGTWQARLVSQAAGTIAVLLLGLAVARLAGREAGLMAAGLLATNYVGVMYDRAAIMESSMTAFLVVAWYAAVRAQRTPAWGLLAGLAAILAYFTKAAAAFFIAALIFNSVWTLVERRRAGAGGRGGGRDSLSDEDARRERAAALWTMGGIAVSGALAIVWFVGPSWSDYRFYNWQMSVTRKPAYTIKALVDRVTWVPILHDLFTRMFLVWALALFAWFGRVATWLRVPAAERLLALWAGAGLLELLVHDVGNERRFVLLIPAVTALAALLLGRDRTLLPPAIATWIARSTRRALAPIVEHPRWRGPLVTWPIVASLALLVAYLAYLLVGPLARLPFLYQVRPGVRLSAGIACVLMVGLVATWPRFPRWAASAAIAPRLAASIVAVALIANLFQCWQFFAWRTFKNYEASRALGRLLPPGTPVHGKLANGLALENRIRPIFVGRDFGNYADRLQRHDVPLLLTYVDPELGYEGDVILDVLAAYPHRRVLRTFPVAESTSGHDVAALMEKGPPALPAPPLLQP